MKRVVFIVEGDTEVSFIQKCVIPYLYLKGFTNPMNAQKILTNRKRNKKGGNVGFDYLKNDVARVAATYNGFLSYSRRYKWRGGDCTFKEIDAYFPL